MKVSVCMITYNHDLFIGQAIEGVLNQKTSFPIELIIGEDYSTDNTREICQKYVEKYPEMIELLLPERNLGMIPNFINTLNACTGKYIALCEGDDYWTDPLKLQKQVDFLEANPDYGLVHGDINHLDQKTGKITKAYNKTNNIKIPSGNIFEFLIKPSHSIKTMTTCIRRDLIEEYYLSNNEIMQKDWVLIDISIWLMIAYHSKVHYFDEVFATYRLLPESASRSKSPKRQHAFNLLVYDVRNYFANIFNCTKETKNALSIYYYRMLLKDSIFLRDKKMTLNAITQLYKMKEFGLKDFFRFIYHYHIKYNRFSSKNNISK